MKKERGKGLKCWWEGGGVAGKNMQKVERK